GNGEADEEWLDLGKQTMGDDPGGAYDTDVENVFPDSTEPIPGVPADGGWSTLPSRARLSDGDDLNPEAFVAEDISLHDHLTEQMHLAVKDPAQRLIAHHLIDMVDDDGYLRGDLDAVAGRLGAEPGQVMETLAALQT